jgi:putative flippase GtrA
MHEKIEKMLQNEKLMQFIRFGLNGIFVTAIQYVVYLVLQKYINVNIAYTAGYLVSFAVNFVMTSYFTFRSHPSLKKFIGFSGSHIINYIVQISLLNLFILLGMSKITAPIPAIAGAVMVQFTILRLVYKKKQ